MNAYWTQLTHGPLYIRNQSTCPPHAHTHTDTDTHTDTHAGTHTDMEETVQRRSARKGKGRTRGDGERKQGLLE
jgi:hypothetical protein